jgi:hypothetical protein
MGTNWSVVKGVRIRQRRGSQWEKGRPQPGQKGGGEKSVAQTSLESTEHREMRIEGRSETGRAKKGNGGGGGTK